MMCEWCENDVRLMWDWYNVDESETGMTGHIHAHPYTNTHTQTHTRISFLSSMCEVLILYGFKFCCEIDVRWTGLTGVIHINTHTYTYIHRHTNTHKYTHTHKVHFLSSMCEFWVLRRARLDRLEWGIPTLIPVSYTHLTLPTIYSV